MNPKQERPCTEFIILFKTWFQMSTFLSNPFMCPLQQSNLGSQRSEVMGYEGEVK